MIAGILLKYEHVVSSGDRIRPAQAGTVAFPVPGASAERKLYQTGITLQITRRCEAQLQACSRITSYRLSEIRGGGFNFEADWSIYSCFSGPGMLRMTPPTLRVM